MAGRFIDRGNPLTRFAPIAASHLETFFLSLFTPSGGTLTDTYHGHPLNVHVVLCSVAPVSARP